ncbi:MbnP family copper-binding protein [Sphaerotilus sp.]|uniref:MbnP family copper-binding protein n=1 Tax=Sphaerotilus sp. TaxID=2093942 RepID=UPI0034E283AB
MTMSVFSSARFPLALMAAAALTACGGGEDATTTTPTATTQSVSIDFAATVGNSVLNIGTCADTQVNGIATRGGAAVNAKLTDLRFYVSNVKLLKADGTAVAVTLDESTWQANSGTDSVALIDFEDGTCVNGGATGGTNTKLTGNVASGTYVGVSFVLGVPESLNHVNPALSTTPKPIDASVPGMLWSWQSGRKFMKIELSPENATTAGTYTGGVQTITAAGAQATTTTAGVTTNVANTSTFVYHLGNTGCVADAAATATGGYTCSTNNQVPVTIAAFNPTSQRITMDLQALFAGNNATQNTVSTAAGCMSAADDPQCPAMFTALTGAKSGGTIFRAIAK